MNIGNVLLACVVTVLGLLPLRQMYRWERGPLRFAFVYFVIQHLVYGCGGLALAVFDHGYTYYNFHGYFPWTDGLPRLQLLHLLSLYAGLAGVRVATIGSHRQAAGPVSDQGNIFRYLIQSSGFLLRQICYVSLFLHLIVTVLGWYSTYRSFGSLLDYMIHVSSPVAIVTFFFWGVWWRQAGSDRIIAILGLGVFGVVQMAAGSRGPFLYGALLFAYGFFLTSLPGQLKLRPRQVVMGILAVMVIGWLMVASDDLRSSYRSRKPQNTREWIDRIAGLFRFSNDVGISSAGDILNPRTSPFERAGFHFAARIVDLSSLDVIARTPEQIPYWGWQEGEWTMLATNWLPSFFFPGIPSHEDAGPHFLRRYGWYIQSGEGGTSMPATMLADAWRRFGWVGVLMLHVCLAIFLSKLSRWSSTRMMSRRFSTRWFLIGSSLLASFSIAYSIDWISFVTTLPRRFLFVFGYAVFLTVACHLMRTRRVLRVVSPYLERTLLRSR